MSYAPRPRVVIVGAGYAGLGVARRLARAAERSLRVDLIDGHADHHLITRLHEVAAGRLARSAVVVPLRRVLSCTAIDVHHAWVEGIELDRQQVVSSAGRVGYDVLILAPGSRTDFHNIPGAAELGHPLRTLDDALALRTLLQQRVIAARRSHAEQRRRDLSVVIVGGGYTGVELAGELIERLPRLAARAGLSPSAVGVHLVEASERLLPGHDAWLARRARERLTAMGVSVALSTPVHAVDAEGVVTSDGRRGARTVIWTTGVRGPAWLADSGLRAGVDGRVIVDRYLRAVDQDVVLAIGDAAHLHAEGVDDVPPSAQIAVEQATHVADMLVGGLRGERPRPFAPRVLGEALALGSSTGLARVGGVPLEDGPAQAVKRLAQARYLDSLGGPRLALRQHALSQWTRAS